MALTRASAWALLSAYTSSDSLIAHAHTHALAVSPESRLEPSSVVKRMKDAACARAVSRDDLRAGAELLGNL